MSKTPKKTYPKVNTEVVVPDATPNGSLFVDVGATSGKLINPQTGQIAQDVDCARGYWKSANLNGANYGACDYLIARKSGKIVGVWQINKTKGWKNVGTNSQIPSVPSCHDTSRMFCELLPVSKDLWGSLIGESVHLGRSKNTIRGVFL